MHKLYTHEQHSYTVYRESLTNSMLKHFDAINLDELQQETLKHL